MFANAAEQIDRILALVSKCPERLQEKCFEMLLSAYLDGQKRPSSGHEQVLGVSTQGDGTPAASTNIRNGLGQSQIPDALRSRFQAVAGRIKVPVEQLAGLFDFQLDPYNYHALVVPGVSNAEKSRNVALLLCAKSYLMMSGWQADWQEFRAVCLDQGCWDRANANTTLQKSGLFKSYTSGEGIALSPQGQAAAEGLLMKQAGGSAE